MKEEIAIIGGGIAGLTTAIAFKKSESIRLYLNRPKTLKAWVLVWDLLQMPYRRLKD